MMKKEAKPILIIWTLLLSEFYLEIKDKGWIKNHVTDHLSCLVLVEDKLYLQEMFPDEQLFFVSMILPRYANVINYLVTNMLPPSISKAQRDKIKSDPKYYILDDLYLWKYCANQVIRRCVLENKIISIFTFCHSYGGHFKVKRMMTKLLACSFYRPSSPCNSYFFCKSCYHCQKTNTISKRNEML